MTKDSFYNIKKISRLLLIMEILFWSLYFAVYYYLTSIQEQDLNSKFQFAKPQYFGLITLVIPLFLLYLHALKKKNRMVALLSPSTDTINKQGNFLYSIIQFFLIRSVLVFTIMALAQPIYGKKKVDGIQRSMELVICLDISNSMNTRDIDQTSRLEIAKRGLNAFISKLSGEKIGLCLFAGDAFVQLPLTTDYNAAKLFIDDLSTNYLSKQGTNIPGALETSMEMFTKDDIAQAIFIITDGENHEGGDQDIYNEIKDKKIQVCVLGIGTERGGEIPIEASFPQSGSMLNKNGSAIISRMNPKFIQDIAAKTDGLALVTNAAYPDLQDILTQINHMKRTKSRTLKFEVKDSVYEVPLYFALLCLLLWYFLSSFKIKW